MQKEVFWCSSCLNMSTSPRISFNEKGQCNICSLSEEKKSFDWKKRKQELKENLEKYDAFCDNGYGVIVPVSGGKDGSDWVISSLYFLFMTFLRTTSSHI